MPPGPAAALVRDPQLPKDVACCPCSPLPRYYAFSWRLTAPECIIYFGCAARHADGCQPSTHVPIDDGAPYWIGPKGDFPLLSPSANKPSPFHPHISLHDSPCFRANCRDHAPSNSTCPDRCTCVHAPMHAGAATGCARSPLSLIGASCTGVPGSRVRGLTPDKSFTFLDLFSPMPALSI
jgi:hypothetical protein